MYIEPNSIIKLYKYIPLDTSFNHTLYFANREEQNFYFHGLAPVKYVLNNQSYQRVVKGKMRIEKKADDVYNCNYLAFQNTAYGNKWFYAFITGVEYVNNVTSEITFEIDPLQTYFFDEETEIRECFVEREHSETDEIGDNIQPEPVSFGEYVNTGFRKIMPIIGDMLILIMIADTSQTLNLGNFYNNIFSGCDIYAYNSNNILAIAHKLQEYVQKPEAVISMYMCPKALIPDVPEGGKHLFGEYKTTGDGVYHVTLDPMYGNEDFDGYVPKNKKLYTYPYNYLSLENGCGQSLALRYEFFDGAPEVEIGGTFVMPVKMILRPCGYKGYDTGVACMSESLVLENYPMCSWIYDSYHTWLAQNAVPTVIAGMNTGFSAAINGAINPVGTGLRVVSQIGDTISKFYQASIKADECRGNSANGDVNIATHEQNYYKTRKHVTKDFAQTIDNYFTLFGYATNKVKVPNISSRPHWNYVKTAGCIIRCNAPADDVNKICSIFDNGITFWKHSFEVGDYSLDNSPVEGSVTNA